MTALAVIVGLVLLALVLDHRLASIEKKILGLVVLFSRKDTGA